MTNETRIAINVPVDIETMEKMALFCKIFSVNTLDKLFLRLIEFADEVFSEEPEECDCKDCECCPLCEEDDENENGEVPIEDLINGKVEVTEPTWSEVHKYLMVYIEKHKN